MGVRAVLHEQHQRGDHLQVQLARRPVLRPARTGQGGNVPARGTPQHHEQTVDVFLPIILLPPFVIFLSSVLLVLLPLHILFQGDICCVEQKLKGKADERNESESKAEQ